ncbi:MAG TPA: UDP-N-acetylglucosamine--N-acetylmuramyl-(pentapeptide) pyrophosphoryl-undecaprenol N-acetylglucosamine transferase, partial [Chthonomonadaceae bacterium]|nr:UDP-N-acetylglucosamine--N-acetylmuramyl-(pentapeptide) pyrophosphoryl-undecaprenol N-acetylglucosamine transferase [Chthonomonadaceae bacterium]
VFSPATLLVALSLAKGYFEARACLRAFRADVVVGTGGYVAMAATLAGAHLGLPALILAPDSVPGRTNRLLARYAKQICVVFPETVAQFPQEKTVVTGLPVRAGIVAPPEVTPQAARCRFNPLRADAFTVLVLGGSQGAQAINRLIVEAAPALLEAGVQVLHQAGARNIEAVQQQARDKGLQDLAGYCPIAFLDEEQMPLALRAADVAVCRGGISTLSELMANALPAIVVPLPSAYADHQTANARALEKGGAALLRPENGLSASNLVADLLALRDDPARRQRMAQASRALGRPDAADDVARLVLAIHPLTP